MNDDFMNYMGYRNMVVEDKIGNFLAGIRKGKKTVTVDRGDLTPDEVKHVISEVKRRQKNGDY